jgi:hypothetical protein
MEERSLVGRRAAHKRKATAQDLSARAATRSTGRSVMQVSIRCGFTEARRISQTLVTVHMTETSRRSPSGVMLRASQGSPRYASRPTRRLANSTLRVRRREPEIYPLDYFEAAHEELLARIRQRDDWIKLQLAAQVVLAALASGIKVFDVEADRALLWVAPLALPVALVVCLLVAVEDRLIGHLGKYLGRFSDPVAADSNPGVPTASFNASEEVKAFGRQTLPLRTAALTIVFFLIPSAVAFAPFTIQRPIAVVDWVVVAVNVVVGILIFAVIANNHRFRRDIALRHSDAA